MTGKYLTCARCGTLDKLCGSVTSNGIKQLRVCMKCLIKIMESGDESINDVFYTKQLIEQDVLNSLESGD